MWKRSQVMSSFPVLCSSEEQRERGTIAGRHFLRDELQLHAFIDDTLLCVTEVILGRCVVGQVQVQHTQKTLKTSQEDGPLKRWWLFRVKK